ncbi:hypothetical protein PRUPE_2G251700 [Prunus persica]|uniref:Uncharacterized protein n=1 Tax=Prunus persica TaxID=3760 RepID=A0A251QLD2_PRUPE|nr:hypothetical protein PRUPE_2G251700 [Prunus persica]
MGPYSHWNGTFIVQHLRKVLVCLMCWLDNCTEPACYSHQKVPQYCPSNFSSGEALERSVSSVFFQILKHRKHNSYYEEHIHEHLDSHLHMNPDHANRIKNLLKKSLTRSLNKKST